MAHTASYYDLINGVIHSEFSQDILSDDEHMSGYIKAHGVAMSEQDISYLRQVCTDWLAYQRAQNDNNLGVLRILQANQTLSNNVH